MCSQSGPNHKCNPLSPPPWLHPLEIIISKSVLPIWLSSQSEIRKWQFCFFEEYFMLHSTVVAGEAEEVTHDAGDVVVEGAGGGQEKQ